METKKEMCLKYIKNNPIFICPYCRTSLKITLNDLKCMNGHTFNISKKGELFLVNTSNYKSSKIYDKDLFTHRREFIESNLYKGIYDIVANIINTHMNNNILIMDLGCGEGTHCKKIQEKLSLGNSIIGIDYSKAGISMATDYLKENNIYIVADINNIPIKDKCIDVVIDFLSPYNNEELNRIVKDNSIIIKIVPGEKYLVELREKYKMKIYERESQVKENIKKHFNIIDELIYNHTFQITNNTSNELERMTPLLKSMEKNNSKSLQSVTIDMKVYVVKKMKISKNC